MSGGGANFQNCTHVSELCPVEAAGPYGYAPNLGGNIFFAVLFGLLLIVHTAQGVAYQTWTFLVAMFCSTALEMAGYIGRVRMHYNVWDEAASIMQIVTLIIGPSFTAAGIYLIIKHIVIVVGRQYSLLKPAMFTWLFIVADILSILVQAAGGGLSNSDDADTAKVAGKIVLAGIGIQVATMGICGILGCLFFFNYWRDNHGTGTMGSKEQGSTGSEMDYLSVNRMDEEERPQSPADGGLQPLKAHDIKWMIVGEAFAFVTVFIRCVYRIYELKDGWGAKPMRDETDFMVLDGTMIALASIAFAVLHPGRVFRGGALSKKKY